MANAHPPPHPTQRGSKPVHHLELRVQELGQLFNSMDPTPFLNKDLDREAEAFIEAWAVRFPPGMKAYITVHLAQLPAEGDPSALVAEAIHNHFNYKAERVRHELRQLLRQGRLSLLIGMVFVAVCLGAAEAIGQMGTGVAFTIARESLTIVGWVAMWRPLQIFLYDWWPILGRARLYKDLGGAHVRVVHSG
ncbi:MAG: hypothetical protein A3F78_08155 [Burkholderiales bacterium RIFCSPLOWO2_12_FULL_61_40]|nr:MAG: hypothetical protein A3F78_08155 [Burkholderiales bacterium RIFCSPLOWO2_12_FULL_61_40]